MAMAVAAMGAARAAVAAADAAAAAAEVESGPSVGEGVDCCGEVTAGGGKALMGEGGNCTVAEWTLGVGKVGRGTPG